MKEELLQLKQDIIDISNDLKTNLADKGINTGGTLSELVNRVPDIEGNALAEIGWNLSEEGTILCHGGVENFTGTFYPWPIEGLP